MFYLPWRISTTSLYLKYPITEFWVGLIHGQLHIFVHLHVLNVWELHPSSDSEAIKLCDLWVYKELVHNMHYILVLSSLVAIKRLLWHLLTQNRMQCTSAPRLTTGISNSGTALHINSLCVRVCGWSWVWCLCMPQPAPTSVWFYSQHLTTPTDFGGGGFSEVLSQLLNFFQKWSFYEGRETFSEPICAFGERNGPPRANKSLIIYRQAHQPTYAFFPMSEPTHLSLSHPFC